MTTSEIESLQSVFRDAMAAVCTPVSIVTAMSGTQPHGTTVSAFTSLSMNPPMVLVSLDRRSELLALLREGSLFGLNVLMSSQCDLALRFARKGGTAKFVDVHWDIDTGVPRIPGVGGFLACRVAQLTSGGDHVVVLGDVLTVDSVNSPPLTYYARQFGTHVPVDDSDRSA